MRPENRKKRESAWVVRFWELVGTMRPGHCWLWVGRFDGDGYGTFPDLHWRTRRGLRAHRVAYERVRGPIPEGLTLDHLCRNRACVNPWHLEPVTNVENVLRGEGAGAVSKRKTHCRAGHPFTVENVRVVASHKNPIRVCHICKDLRQRERRERDPTVRTKAAAAARAKRKSVRYQRVA